MSMKEKEQEIKKFLQEKIKKGEPKELFYNPHYNDEELKKYFIEKIRCFLLKGTHSNSETTRILRNIRPDDLMRIADNYYIFTRFYLTLNHKNNVSFNYCAGQDYIFERKQMREIIIKKY